MEGWSSRPASAAGPGWKGWVLLVLLGGSGEGRRWRRWARLCGRTPKCCCVQSGALVCL